jgi:ABC-2 type transport system permease protein
MKVKDYFSLWKEFIKLNVETWLEYRMDFFVGVFAMFISNLTSVVFFWTLFQNIMQINGWNFGQLIFLAGLSSLVIGIWHSFFVGITPWKLERYVRRGEFDRILIQPVNPFIVLLISTMEGDSFGDLLAGILIVYFGAMLSGIQFTLMNILLLGSFVFGSVLIFFSITVIVSTLAFWVTRSGAIGEIIWSLTRFIDFPLDIYNPFIKFLLTFLVPLAFINYYPAEILLGKGEYSQIAYLTPVIGIVLLIIAYNFWKIGLKNYASSGS